MCMRPIRYFAADLGCVGYYRFVTSSMAFDYDIILHEENNLEKKKKNYLH